MSGGGALAEVYSGWTLGVAGAACIFQGVKDLATAGTNRCRGHQYRLIRRDLELGEADFAGDADAVGCGCCANMHPETRTKVWRGVILISAGAGMIGIGYVVNSLGVKGIAHKVASTICNIVEMPNC